MFKINLGVFAFGAVLFSVYLGVVVTTSIRFDQDCEGYLKRAADANTVELAKKQLDIALNYIENEGLTNNYTSVLWKTPDEDISFWYTNLIAARIDLESITEDSTGLERSNMLMKLRETLLDQGESSMHVTHPSGISLYPHNGMLGTIAFIGFGLMLVSSCGMLFSASNK